MDLFEFDLASYRDEFVEQGWVQLRSGIDGAFLDQCNSLGTVSLQLKCNDVNCDRLDENPTTIVRAPETAALLRLTTAVELGGLVPILARQREWVGTLRGRDGIDRAFAKLWDKAPIRLTGTQHALPQALDARALEQPIVGFAETNREDDLRNLASRGLIDLLPRA